MELKKYEVARDIRAALIGFECWGVFYSKTCDDPIEVHMKVKVTNGSKEAVSRVTVGLAIPTDATCPSTYAEKHTLDVNLSPGETRETQIKYVDAAFKKSRFCLKALEVQFARE